MEPRQCYDEIVDDLLAQNDDCTAGQMMGMPCVKRSGKIVAGFWPRDGEMVFKLPRVPAREDALALKGAHLFDPSGKGRPFKEWVAVPPAHTKRWAELAQRALDA